jgi:hypothetical protein
VDNEVELFTLTGVPSGYTSAGPMAISYRVKKLDPGARTIKSVYDSGGGQVLSAAKGVSTSYVKLQDIYDQDAGADWNDTKLNALKVGVKATT